MMGELFSFPRKIQVQTINLCNYACRMCPYPALSDLKAERLDRGLFSRIIQDVRAAGRRVSLCLMLQNEPLLDKRFAEMVAEAHEASDAITDISTVTNGSALTPALLTLLMNYPRFGLTVSINATEREQYRQIHGVDLLDKVTSLLRAWPGPRERIRLSFVADAESVSKARAFQEEWRPHKYRTRLVPLLARAGAMEVGRDRRLVYDDSYSFCHYPMDTLNVIADGRVILCCQDWKHATTYGNLKEATISEVWNAPALKRLREAALRGSLREEVEMCAGCDYPMRSSMRLALEAMFSESREVTGKFPVVEHGSLLRLKSEGGDMRVMVCDIDAAAGVVQALVSASDPCLAALASDGGAAFRIGGLEGEAFSFGSMTPVWCPVSSVELQSVSQMPLVALRICLDPSAEAFQLLPWYRAEWEHPRANAQSAPK